MKIIGLALFSTCALGAAIPLPGTVTLGNDDAPSIKPLNNDYIVEDFTPARSGLDKLDSPHKRLYARAGAFPVIDFGSAGVPPGDLEWQHLRQQAAAAGLPFPVYKPARPPTPPVPIEVVTLTPVAARTGRFAPVPSPVALPAPARVVLAPVVPMPPPATISSSIEPATLPLTPVHVDSRPATPYLGSPAPPAAPVDSRPSTPADSRPLTPANSRPLTPADPRPLTPMSSRPSTPYPGSPAPPVTPPSPESPGMMTTMDSETMAPVDSVIYDTPIESETWTPVGSVLRTPQDSRPATPMGSGSDVPYLGSPALPMTPPPAPARPDRPLQLTPPPEEQTSPPLLAAPQTLPVPPAFLITEINHGESSSLAPYDPYAPSETDYDDDAASFVTAASHQPSGFSSYLPSLPGLPGLPGGYTLSGIWGSLASAAKRILPVTRFTGDNNSEPDYDE